MQPVYRQTFISESAQTPEKFLIYEKLELKLIILKPEPTLVLAKYTTPHSAPNQ